MVTSEVWAGKVDTYYNEVTDNMIRLGQIEFSDFPEAFVKTIRMYNKNASKHLYYPQFIYYGKVYICSTYSVPSKTGRGSTHYWEVSKTDSRRMPVSWSMINEDKVSFTDEFVCRIPKSKVNDKNWRNYYIRR